LEQLLLASHDFLTISPDWQLAEQQLFLVIMAFQIEWCGNLLSVSLKHWHKCCHEWCLEWKPQPSLCGLGNGGRQ